MKALLDRILERIRDDRPNDNPGEWLPVQPRVLREAVDAAEVRLGFRLPDLLRQLYTRIGNGGFGPGFGLIPLSTASLGSDPPPAAEFNLLGDYFLLVDQYAAENGGWPPRLVPAFYFGCTSFEFVDCRDAAGPVIGFDPGSEELEWVHGQERVVASSLEERLESWLAGEPVAW
jgi:hypothetical protein